MPPAFPRPLSSYAAAGGASLLDQLSSRVQAEPFNLAATLLFALAIVHTFLAPWFVRAARRAEDQRRAGRMLTRGWDENEVPENGVSFKAEVLYLLGEVEAIFGIWAVPLLLAITLDKGWPAARDYLGQQLDFTEPLFVVVVMTIAASRPILTFSEQMLSVLAALGNGSPRAWWLSVLTVGPLLGSFITEPAAMTISALLLSKKFFHCKPSPHLAYATLGLLFVNVSVGGTLTHFAAPPVLMVAPAWGWGLSHMMTQFGWKAVAGIGVANALYLLAFQREFRRLATLPSTQSNADSPAAQASRPIPLWITAVHVLFLGWTVINNHYPALFIGGFLFYIAFTEVTQPYQSELALRPALLVGFFLAGLVVHGGLQGWWIAPVLSRLNENSLFVGAAVLTAFNDNAAITYLGSLVPNLSAALKYALVSGAVVGGGLTVIANAPNPAGQSILSPFFPNGVSPWRLFLGALPPTFILAAAFLWLRW
jgi:hypothetical protein